MVQPGWPSLLHKLRPPCNYGGVYPAGVLKRPSFCRPAGTVWFNQAQRHFSVHQIRKQQFTCAGIGLAFVYFTVVSSPLVWFALSSSPAPALAQPASGPALTAHSISARGLHLHSADLDSNQSLRIPLRSTRIHSCCALAQHQQILAASLGSHPALGPSLPAQGPFCPTDFSVSSAPSLQQHSNCSGDTPTQQQQYTSAAPDPYPASRPALSVQCPGYSTVSSGSLAPFLQGPCCLSASPVSSASSPQQPRLHSDCTPAQQQQSLTAVPDPHPALGPTLQVQAPCLSTVSSGFSAPFLQGPYCFSASFVSSASLQAQQQQFRSAAPDPRPALGSSLPAQDPCRLTVSSAPSAPYLQWLRISIGCTLTQQQQPLTAAPDPDPALGPSLLAQGSCCVTTSFVPSASSLRLTNIN